MKSGGMKGNLRIPRVPLEWYAGGVYGNGSNVWRLPSGKALAEFALQAGFMAPLLFKPGIPTPAKATRLESVGAVKRISKASQ
jgi:hypothetical protein